MIRTPEEVRADFRRKGLSFAEWARAKGYNPNLITDVMSGRNKATRGQSHRIAVELGLKEGEIVPDRDIARAINA